LNEIGFQIAKAISDAASGKLLHDPRYVDFVFTVWNVDDGSYNTEHIGRMHPCSEDDYSKFYPRSISATKTYDKFYKEKSLMCMGEFDNNGVKVPKILYGMSGTDSRSIDLNFIPCVPKQLTPENKHLVDKECIADYNDPKSLEKKF
jgi:hypothetical protein